MSRHLDGPHGVRTDSLGGALTVAGQVRGTLGPALAAVARGAVCSGMDLAFTVGAGDVAAGLLVVLAALPSRAEGPKPQDPDTSPAAPVADTDRKAR